jgi:hypothetical protein
MTESQALMRLAAERGHRTPAGHRCHNVKALIELVAEHPNQARRQMALLVEQTAGLAQSLSSHDRGGAH